MVLPALKIRSLSIRLTLTKDCFELHDQTSEYSKHSLPARPHVNYEKDIPNMYIILL